MITRRALLAASLGQTVALAAGASSSSSSSPSPPSSSSSRSPSSPSSPSPLAAEEPATALRMLRVRSRTTLVDLGGRRVLVDPCFAPDLGAGILFDAPAPAVSPEELGDVDVLCVSAREPGAFDGASTRALRGRTASCFVPDEETATILRHQGYRRVRVVVAGDAFTTRGVTVTMSPTAGLFGGAAVGFHLARGGRTLWHAGAPPPLDVGAGPAAFAREHPAELVLAHAAGLSIAGAQRTIDREDALLLAGLCRARYAVFLDDGDGPSLLGGLVMKAGPGSQKPPPGVKVRVVVVEPGRWYRVVQP